MTTSTAQDFAEDARHEERALDQCICCGQVFTDADQLDQHSIECFRVQHSSSEAAQRTLLEKAQQSQCASEEKQEVRQPQASVFRGSNDVKGGVNEPSAVQSVAATCAKTTAAEEALRRDVDGFGRANSLHANSLPNSSALVSNTVAVVTTNTNSDSNSIINLTSTYPLHSSRRRRASGIDVDEQQARKMDWERTMVSLDLMQRENSERLQETMRREQSMRSYASSVMSMDTNTMNSIANNSMFATTATGVAASGFRSYPRMSDCSPMQSFAATLPAVSTAASESLGSRYNSVMRRRVVRAAQGEVCPVPQASPQRPSLLPHRQPPTAQQQLQLQQQRLTQMSVDGLGHRRSAHRNRSRDVLCAVEEWCKHTNPRMELSASLENATASHSPISAPMDNSSGIYEGNGTNNNLMECESAASPTVAVDSVSDGERGDNWCSELTWVIAGNSSTTRGPKGSRVCDTKSAAGVALHSSSNSTSTSNVTLVSPLSTSARHDRTDFATSDGKENMDYPIHKIRQDYSRSSREPGALPAECVSVTRASHDRVATNSSFSGSQSMDTARCEQAHNHGGAVRSGSATPVHQSLSIAASHSDKHSNNKDHNKNNNSNSSIIRRTNTDCRNRSKNNDSNSNSWTIAAGSQRSALQSTAETIRCPIVSSDSDTPRGAEVGLLYGVSLHDSQVCPALPITAESEHASAKATADRQSTMQQNTHVASSLGAGVDVDGTGHVEHGTGMDDVSALLRAPTTVCATVASTEGSDACVCADQRATAQRAWREEASPPQPHRTARNGTADTIVPPLSFSGSGSPASTTLSCRTGCALTARPVTSTRSATSWGVNSSGNSDTNRNNVFQPQQSVRSRVASNSNNHHRHSPQSKHSAPTHDGAMNKCTDANNSTSIQTCRLADSENGRVGNGMASVAPRRHSAITLSTSRVTAPHAFKSSSSPSATINTAATTSSNRTGALLVASARHCSANDLYAANSLHTPSAQAHRRQRQAFGSQLQQQQEVECAGKLLHDAAVSAQSSSVKNRKVARKDVANEERAGQRSDRNALVVSNGGRKEVAPCHDGKNSNESNHASTITNQDDTRDDRDAMHRREDSEREHRFASLDREGSIATTATLTNVSTGTRQSGTWRSGDKARRVQSFIMQKPRPTRTSELRRQDASRMRTHNYHDQDHPLGNSNSDQHYSHTRMHSDPLVSLSRNSPLVSTRNSFVWGNSGGSNGKVNQDQLMSRTVVKEQVARDSLFCTSSTKAVLPSSESGGNPWDAMEATWSAALKSLVYRGQTKEMSDISERSYAGGWRLKASAQGSTVTARTTRDAAARTDRMIGPANDDVRGIMNKHVMKTNTTSGNTSNLDTSRHSASSGNDNKPSGCVPTVVRSTAIPSTARQVEKKKSSNNSGTTGSGVAGGVSLLTHDTHSCNTARAMPASTPAVDKAGLLSAMTITPAATVKRVRELATGVPATARPMTTRTSGKLAKSSSTAVTNKNARPSVVLGRSSNTARESSCAINTVSTKMHSKSLGNSSAECADSCTATTTTPAQGTTKTSIAKSQMAIANVTNDGKVDHSGATSKDSNNERKEHENDVAGKETRLVEAMTTTAELSGQNDAAATESGVKTRLAGTGYAGGESAARNTGTVAPPATGGEEEQPCAIGPVPFCVSCGNRHVDDAARYCAFCGTKRLYV